MSHLNNNASAELQQKHYIDSFLFTFSPYIPNLRQTLRNYKKCLRQIVLKHFYSSS